MTGILLLVLGGVLETSGVLFLVQPQLAVLLPRAAAIGMIALGGMLTAAGIISLAMQELIESRS